jgi:hypothetical protein
VQGCKPSGNAGRAASVLNAKAHRLWTDTTGNHQQMALSYDERTHDLFVLMSLPVSGTNTFTVYRYHVG